MKTFGAIPAKAIPQNRERGSAVVVLLVLLTIMLILVAANGKTLLNLQKEMKLLERQQVHHLNTVQTNATVVGTPPGRPAPTKP